MSDPVYTSASKDWIVPGSGKVVIQNFWMGLAATFDFSKLPSDLHAYALRDLMRSRNSNP